ncbi:hypothetical protein [Halostagnicola sp. A-GB9-2]|nr:hypothetical protein [Halostagnicola sp. A-GB9-2]MDJ1431703.1 hypothetical protein [Halostagnicola sp. A-GB9-2]
MNQIILGDEDGSPDEVDDGDDNLGTQNAPRSENEEGLEKEESEE